MNKNTKIAIGVVVGLGAIVGGYFLVRNLTRSEEKKKEKDLKEQVKQLGESTYQGVKAKDFFDKEDLEDYIKGKNLGKKA